MPRILTALAVSLSIMAAPVYGQVSAEDKAKAKELFSKGVGLYKKGKHAQALENFKQSFKLRPHWRLHLNIGLCYKELSMYTEAKAEFEAFVKGGKDKLDEASKETVSAELEELKGIIAVLEIEVANHGATVKLDGKQVGTSPLLDDVEVNPGSHVIDVVMDGHKPHHEEFLLSKGEKKQFSITLEVLPQEEPVPVGPEPEEKKTRHKAAPAFWALGGLTVALAGGATAMGVLTIKKKGELDDLDKAQRDLYPDGYTPAVHDDYLDERKEVQDSGKLFGILTTAFMAGAGAALVATVVVGVVTHPFAPKEQQPEPEEAPVETAEPGVALQIAPLPLPEGGGMVVVGGTF
jgi:hypothetical protein